ncbi:hypothetical protein DL240_07160 [Lujinxingia litoralis]|uniref:Uncharacterized protein n=1 Tax=Lujinxingia litoralis TaxID=2211119 RepID=A0A328CBN8_9DELT|nr:hypothetical protein DL240_07160 [Lujinxingia litoralis]
MCLLGLVVGALCLSGEVAAQSILASSYRVWDSPQGVDPRLAQVREDGEGTTLLVMTEGEGADARCVVVVADPQEALSYRFRRAGAPSSCADAVVMPGGGFVVRGERRDLPPDLPAGFVARIARSGEELWAVEDRELLDAPEEIGAYVGAWEATLASVAFEPRSGLVVALTRARESVGGSVRSSAQLHAIDAESGALRAVGERPLEALGELVERVDADPQGGFLVTAVATQQGTRRLHRYDGAGGWQAVVPRISGWEEREVVGPVRALADGSIAVFWRVRGQGQSGVTRLQGDEVVFDRVFDNEAELDGRVRQLDDVARGWVAGEQLGVFRISREGPRIFELLSAEDGRRLAVSFWDRLAPGLVLGLVRDRQGAFVALTYIPTDESLREYQLRLGDASDRSPGTGSGDEGAGAEGGGCAVAGSRGEGAAGWVGVVGILGWLRRRRAKKSTLSP